MNMIQFLEAGISIASRATLRDFHFTNYVSQAFFRSLARQNESRGLAYFPSFISPSEIASIVSKAGSRIVFVGGSDVEWTESMAQGLSSSTSALFFVQNLNTPESNQVKLLPIGLEDAFWGRAGMPWHFRGSLTKRAKVRRVLVGPFGSTHESRRELTSTIFETPNIHVERSRLSYWEYSSLASRHLYVACPSGNGLDTHRVWETLARGSIPIIIDSPWARNLQKQLVDAVLLESWNSLSDESRWITKEFQFSDQVFLKKSYWSAKINNLLDSF